MVVVDTSVWIDYGLGLETHHTNALDYELARGNVVTGDFIKLEFLLRKNSAATAKQWRKPYPKRSEWVPVRVR